MCGTRLHIWTQVSDDWLKATTCISENVTISFKHEYRRPTLTSRCDVINIKNTFLGTIFDDLPISDVKMNLSKIFQNFKMAAILMSGRGFTPEIVPEFE